MRVVFIAAECEPWAKTGGLADVVDSLARAVGREPSGRVAEPVDVFLPRYRGLPVPEAAIRRELAVPDPMAPTGRSTVGLVEADVAGYRLRLVDHPPAFDRDGIYGDRAGDFPDNAWRFGLLARAALEALRGDGRPVDVLHIHDWHAVPVLLFRDRWYADDPLIGRAAVLLTLHNLAYHGWVPLNRLRELGLASGEPGLPVADGRLDLLRAGIESADLVNTVSPSYADEALTPEFGGGLESALRARGDRFFGILNGLDTDVGDPDRDEVLAARYSAAEPAGKGVDRIDLLRRLGMEVEDPGPVLGMIGRLDPQKGFDLLAGAADRLLDRGARLVVLGDGQNHLVAGLRALASARPDRLAVLERFDRDLARRIYAGIDMFLMPSRFEPCGLGQLVALRYGSPPVVRRTGGLRDTVLDVGEEPDAGTGFAFDEATPSALLGAAERAMTMFESRPAEWAALVRRGMSADFSWRTGSAPRYVDAYERAVALRRRG